MDKTTGQEHSFKTSWENFPCAWAPGAVPWAEFHAETEFESPPDNSPGGNAELEFEIEFYPQNLLGRLWRFFSRKNDVAHRVLKSDMRNISLGCCPAFVFTKDVQAVLSRLVKKDTKIFEIEQVRRRVPVRSIVTLSDKGARYRLWARLEETNNPSFQRNIEEWHTHISRNLLNDFPSAEFDRLCEYWVENNR